MSETADIPTTAQAEAPATDPADMSIEELEAMMDASPADEEETPPPEDPAGDPTSDPAPVEAAPTPAEVAPPEKPTALDAETLVKVLANMQPQQAPAPKPPTEEDQLKAERDYYLSPEGLSAYMRSKNLPDTPEARATARMHVIQAAETVRMQRELAAIREQQRQFFEQQRQGATQAAVEPALKFALGSAKIPEKGLALVRHYTAEYIGLGHAPEEAAKLALAETGFDEIVKSAPPAAPAKPPASPQIRGSDRAVAASNSQRGAPTPPKASKMSAEDFAKLERGAAKFFF